MNAAITQHVHHGLETAGRRVDIVVIDLLGGLCHERERIGACMAKALSNADFHAEPGDIAQLACLPCHVALERWIASTTSLAPDVIRPLVVAVRQDFRERLTASIRASPEIRTFPGAATLLAELGAHGISVAIDSELDGDIATDFLRAAGFAGKGWVDAVVGADEVATPRPGPGQVEEALRRCGHGAGAVVVKVAGSAIDAQAAIRAGCASIFSLEPNLVVGRSPVSDLGELAERMLGRPIP